MGLRHFAGLGLVLAASTVLTGCLNTTPRYRRPPQPIPVKGTNRTPAAVPGPAALPGNPQAAPFNTSAGNPANPATSGSNFRTVAPSAPAPLPAPTPAVGTGPTPSLPPTATGPAPLPAPPGPAPSFSAAPNTGSNVTITQPPFGPGPSIQPPSAPR